MDKIVNSLYRTRLQFGYSPGESQNQAPANSSKAQYAYQGIDVAEISPLAIVFYTSAQDEEGGFRDLSQAFAESPFGRFLDDYSKQARQIIQSQKNEQPSKHIFSTYEAQEKTKQTLVNTLDLSLQQANQLLLNSKNVKDAYFPPINIDGTYSQHSTNYLV